MPGIPSPLWGADGGAQVCRSTVAYLSFASVSIVRFLAALFDEEDKTPDTPCRLCGAAVLHVFIPELKPPLRE